MKIYDKREKAWRVDLTQRGRTVSALPDGLYYIQDKRQYVGNAILFWAKDEKGYTTNPNSAQKYSRAELMQVSLRDTDIVWPVDYIDKKTKPMVDMQYLDPLKSV